MAAKKANTTPPTTTPADDFDNPEFREFLDREGAKTASAQNVDLAGFDWASLIPIFIDLYKKWRESRGQ